MLLIYIDRQTNRLGYTINLIFKELLDIEYMVTTSKDQFIALDCAKLSYCKEKIYDELHITSDKLLFETNIYSVNPTYTKEDGIDKIFRTYGEGDDFHFDLFSAVFYLVSRYEEHLPFIRDEHSRFCTSDSILQQKNCLDKPVVNIWVNLLKEKLLEKYPSLEFPAKHFHFINTIDVDMAYSYKGKGVYRTIGGMCRDIINGQFSAVKERFRVLLSLEKDPYDCFDYILRQVDKYHLNTIFFFLMSMHNKFDKNISPYNHSFQMLIKRLSDYCEIGIHPSYYSIEEPDGIEMGMKMLSNIIHRNINCSRFHYLRFHLPSSFRDIYDIGVRDEYSVGYAEHIGFRAGICSPYNFYDLERDQETKLRVHPFMFMDVALKNGLKLNTTEAWQKIKQLIDEVKKVNGELISIWHNESLSDTGQWQGWRNLYEKQLEYIKEIDN